MAEGKLRAGEGAHPAGPRGPLDEGPRPGNPPATARRLKHEAQMSPGRDYPMTLPESKREYDPANPNRIMRGDGAPD